MDAQDKLDSPLGSDNEPHEILPKKNGDKVVQEPTAKRPRGRPAKQGVTEDTDSSAHLEAMRKLLKMKNDEIKQKQNEVDDLNADLSTAREEIALLHTENENNKAELKISHERLKQRNRDYADLIIIFVATSCNLAGSYHNQKKVNLTTGHCNRSNRQFLK